MCQMPSETAKILVYKLHSSKMHVFKRAHVPDCKDLTGLGMSAVNLLKWRVS